MRRIFFFLIVLTFAKAIPAQRLPDHVYMPNIRTPKLFQQNNQQSLPLITLGAGDQLELHFDDMLGVVIIVSYHTKHIIKMKFQLISCTQCDQGKALLVILLK